MLRSLHMKLTLILLLLIGAIVGLKLVGEPH